MPDRLPPPYTAADVARALGVTRTHFYRRYEALVAAGMPASLIPRTGRERLAFERSSMDAWLTRHHPARGRIGGPANDAERLPQPARSDEWQRYFQAAYGPYLQK